MDVMLPSEQETKDYETALLQVKTSQENKIKARTAGKKIEEEYNFKLNSMKETHRQMFMLFTMDGCPACKVIKYLIRYNQDIKNALDPYEIMIINVTNVDCHLVKKMNVYSYPAYFMIDKDENIIKKNYGCNALHDPVIPIVNWINMQVDNVVKS